MEQKTKKKVIKTFSLEPETAGLLKKMAKTERRTLSAIIDKLVQDAAKSVRE